MIGNGDTVSGFALVGVKICGNGTLWKSVYFGYFIIMSRFKQTRALLRDETIGRFLNSLDREPTPGPPKPPHIVAFNTNSTIGEVMRQLAATNILSAPICDATTGDFLAVVEVRGGVRCGCCIRLQHHA